MGDFLHDNRLYYSSIEFAMVHIGGTWKMPIILALRHGPVRYGDLKELIPHISHKMLITQLRELEKRNMVQRHTFYEKPPRVEYSLTPLALQALPVIGQLSEYGALLKKQAGITDMSDMESGAL